MVSNKKNHYGFFLLGEILLEQSKITFEKKYSINQNNKLMQYGKSIQRAHSILHDTKNSTDYTGWVNWPCSKQQELTDIVELASKINKKADVFITIGIGGSYLGAYSAIELLQPIDSKPEMIFLGNNISANYIKRILSLINHKEVYVNVISKSGTTLEPALAFRYVRKLMEEKYGKDGARERIIVTTDKEKGALKKLADQEGYQTFVIPDSIGGRYSVLTPVGLLPMAVAGINIEEIMDGAKAAYHLYNNPNLAENECYQYAAIRNVLYQDGKTVELLATYEPTLQPFSEWWKQLFGESEGKEGKGIFPSSVNYPTDLHSLGQYIQEGPRNMFETTLWVENSAEDLDVPELEGNIDGLNYLIGKSLHEINNKVCEGVMKAHMDGGIPSLKITIPEMTPFYYGQLVYFFEKACAMSGYLLGVNPFDQPGVEAYKRNVYSLLKA